MEFSVRNDRANSFTRLNQFDEARQEYYLCIAIGEELDDRSKMWQAHMNLGEMERSAGQVNVAVTKLQEAAALARDLTDELAEGQTLGNLGIALAQSERYKEAEAAFKGARRLGRRTKSLTTEAMAVGGLAQLLFNADHPAKAIPLYLKAIALEEKAGERVQLAEDLAAITQAYAAIDDLENTQVYGQRLVELAQRTRLENVAANGLCRAARWMLRFGRAEDARSTYATALLLAMPKDDESANDLYEVMMLMVFQSRMENAQGNQNFLDSVITEISSITSFDQDTEILQFLQLLLQTATDACDSIGG
jgi:tetratricopeptide (TPR) repeat protein